MTKNRIWLGFVAVIAVTTAWGCSYLVLAGPGEASDSGQVSEPGSASGSAPGSAPRADDRKTPKPRASRPRRTAGGKRFLGHLAVKGGNKDQRNLMTSIVVHPRMWERRPYVLFDEWGFGHKYSNSDPMSIKINELRAESVWDAQTAAHFWSSQPVHVMVDIEGWSPQYDATRGKIKKQTPEAAFNRQAVRVYRAIQSGIKEGWPEIQRFGWFSNVVDVEFERKWNLEQTALETNMQAAPIWRRVSYLAPSVYQFMRLVEEGGDIKKYEADSETWAKPFHDKVRAAVELREALRGRQLVLPCMWGTTISGRAGYGKGNDRWAGQYSTEQERRLMVRTVYDAGADGIMVWQPIRTEAERDEFQRAITHIEKELALINGDTDLGQTMTLGELFRIRRDWPGRPMDWMRNFEWGPPTTDARQPPKR